MEATDGTRHPIRVKETFERAWSRSDLIITTGGLGPTEDDVTRKVVARVLQRQLVLNDEILEKLQRRFKARGVEMPPNNARQALVLTGSDVTLASMTGPLATPDPAALRHPLAPQEQRTLTLHAPLGERETLTLTVGVARFAIEATERR